MKRWSIFVGVMAAIYTANFFMPEPPMFEGKSFLEEVLMLAFLGGFVVIFVMAIIDLTRLAVVIMSRNARVRKALVRVPAQSVLVGALAVSAAAAWILLGIIWSLTGDLRTSREKSSLVMPELIDWMGGGMGNIVWAGSDEGPYLVVFQDERGKERKWCATWYQVNFGKADQAKLKGKNYPDVYSSIPLPKGQKVIEVDVLAKGGN